MSPNTPLCCSRGDSAVSQMVFNKHSSPLNPALKATKTKNEEKKTQREEIIAKIQLKFQI